MNYMEAYVRRCQAERRRVSYDYVGIVLTSPEKFTPELWYEAMALLMAERAPA